MSYANVSELKACLRDCVKFCREHSDRSYCQEHLSRLERGLSELRKRFEMTDQYYARWKAEHREDRQTWKKLAKNLKSVQNKLERIEAIGFPDERVSYWDEERLEAVARNMIDYLREHVDDIEFAEDEADRLERGIDSGHSDHHDNDKAFDTYHRFAQYRGEALSHASQVIAGFRESMRRNLGKDHPDYQEIRWAQSVSPDQSVL